MSLGAGTQQIWPLNSEHYFHENFFVKLRVEYLIKSKKLDFELFLHPEVNLATHKSTNPPWIGEDQIDHNLLRTMYQYVLNVGVLLRKSFPNKMSVYGAGSIGPLYVDTGTERLHKGFAFADVIALGVSYKPGRVMIDLRSGLRHVSNADTRFPNSGYNSVNVELGIVVDI